MEYCRRYILLAVIVIAFVTIPHTASIPLSTSSSFLPTISPACNASLALWQSSLYPGQSFLTACSSTLPFTDSGRFTECEVVNGLFSSVWWSNGQVGGVSLAGLCGPPECQQEDFDILYVLGPDTIYKQTVYTLFTPLSAALSFAPSNWTANPVIVTVVVPPSLAGDIPSIITISIVGLLAVLIFFRSNILDYFVDSRSGKRKASNNANAHGDDRPSLYSLMNDTPAQDPSFQSSALSSFLNCFQYRTIFSSLFTPDPKDETFTLNLQSLHFFRFWSFVSILFLHSYIFALSNADVNTFSAFVSTLSTFSFNAITVTGIFGVDTFLLLGGLLATKSLLKTLKFQHNDTNSPQTFLFPFSSVIRLSVLRYLRVIPTTMFWVVFSWRLSPFLCEGPFSVILPTTPLQHGCPDYWWTTLLLVNNFVPTSLSNICLAWTWYLSIDLQLFIALHICVYLVSQFSQYQRTGPEWLRYIYRRETLFVLLSLGVALSVSIVAGLASRADWSLTTSHSPPPGPAGPVYADEVYTKPYTRMVPYLLGIVIALLGSTQTMDIPHTINNNGVDAAGNAYDIDLAVPHGNGNEVEEDSHKRLLPPNRLKWWLYFLTNIICLSALVVVVFINYDINRSDVSYSYWSHAQNISYLCLARLTWSVGIGWFIWCIGQSHSEHQSHNTGFQWLYRIAKWDTVWIPLGRVTFQSYLCHPIVIAMMVYSEGSYYTYYDWNFIVQCLGLFIVSMIFALIAYCFIEKPIDNVVSLIFKKKKKSL